ncbi:hypothetical protein EMGBD3_13230 [Nitrosarchaeum sp.]|nr:hypothetical protein EMGBD3_13230 [Nitrosarchaeum sp.]
MEKIKQKIHETISNKEEIRQLIQLLSNIDDSKSFALGIVVGRLYNAFYYQTKRILNREPTKFEFEEFLEFVKSKKSALEDLW